MKTNQAVGLSLLLLASSCSSKPDASGIYLQVEDRAVAFVQLVQSDDGKLSGRVETATIGNDGTVIHKDATEQGSISGHNIILQPVSIWYGGMQASGTLSGDTLTLTRDGSTLSVKRSSLEEYQKAVSALEAKAAQEQQAAAEARAQKSAADAQARRSDDVVKANNLLTMVADRLRADTAKLNEAIAHCPDFGSRAAANTDRMQRLVQEAQSAGSGARGQLRVDANQIGIDTNQIEIERGQYAITLNSIASDSGEGVTVLGKLCGTNSPAELSQACETARTASKDFDSAKDRGRAIFLPYKQRLQSEYRHQAQLARSIG